LEPSSYAEVGSILKSIGVKVNWPQSKSASSFCLRTTRGNLFHVAPGYDPGAEADISRWFEECYSIRFRNYPVGDDYSHEAERVECGN
jgi:Formylmethanofuran dehydrogenase subunit A